MRTVKLLRIPFFALAALGCAGGAMASVFGEGVPLACVEGLQESGSQAVPEPSWGIGLPMPLLYLPGGTPDTANVSRTRRISFSLSRRACGNGQAAMVLYINDFHLSDGSSNALMPRFRAVQDGRTTELRVMRIIGGERLASGTMGNIRGGFTTFLVAAEDPSVDLNREFDFFVDDPLTLAPSLPTRVDAYTPTPETYPDAFGPRPFSGRYAGNFFDPAKPGEGMVVEIGDVSGQPDQHFLQFAWHSFDTNGEPFWISGGASYSGRSTHLQMPAAYRRGGRFGGSRPAETQSSWGTVDIEFSDCRTANIDYQANAKLPAGIPAGSGHLQWQRLTGISGYSCE